MVLGFDARESPRDVGGTFLAKGDLVASFYRESRLPARVRFFIEELLGELNP